MTEEHSDCKKKRIFFFQIERERDRELLICTDRIIDQSRDQYPGFCVRIIR